MAKLLYTLPFPSSAKDKGTQLQELPGRIYTLECRWWSISADDGYVPKEEFASTPKQVKIIFEQVQAYKCTHWFARSLKQLELFASDKLVDLETTDWLKDVQANVNRNSLEPVELHHLMICFDDEPCYEFLCPNFRIETQL